MTPEYGVQIRAQRGASSLGTLLGCFLFVEENDVSYEPTNAKAPQDYCYVQRIGQNINEPHVEQQPMHKEYCSHYGISNFHVRIHFPSFSTA